MPQTTSEHKPAGPRILVSGSLSSPYASDYLACTLREFSDSAFAGLRAAGASVSFVEASAPQLTQREALEGVDGVLMLGGADADPQTYGQQVVADSVYGIHRAADDYEIGLLQLARE
jgi:putative glutamine amidotransferase